MCIRNLQPEAASKPPRNRIYRRDTDSKQCERYKKIVWSEQQLKDSIIEFNCFFFLKKYSFRFNFTGGTKCTYLQNDKLLRKSLR